MESSSNESLAPLEKLTKSKSWGPFWSYQLDSSANPYYLKNGPNGLNWKCAWLVAPKLSRVPNLHFR